jgi:tetratricopeptide (TPR) repeat protein
MNTSSDRNLILFNRKIFIFNILLLLLLTINSNIAFVQSDDLLLKKGIDLYLEAKDIFIVTNSKNDGALNILEESAGFFRTAEDNEIKNYWLAKTAYLMGIIEKDRNNHEKAEEHFVSSKELILKSLECGDFSDGYRLLADVEGQLITYRDFLYMTKYGPPIKNMITKAIKIDPHNVMAYLSLAMYYRDAPLIAGGDIKKSKSVLEEMVALTSHDKMDLFSLYIWIDTAWTNSDNNQEKVSAYISLLDLFSNKPDIISMAERIERKYMNSK